MEKHICGVDIASKKMDARIGLKGVHKVFELTTSGIKDLIDFCLENKVELVVMEATGGYEKLPHKLISQAGLAVAIVNPLWVRRFAESQGYFEKTDKIDAGIIARYGEVSAVKIKAAPEEKQEKLKSYVVYLRQLIQFRAALKTQMRQSNNEHVIASQHRQMHCHNKEIAEMVTCSP